MHWLAGALFQNQSMPDNAPLEPTMTDQKTIRGTSRNNATAGIAMPKVPQAQKSPPKTERGQTQNA